MELLEKDSLKASSVGKDRKKELVKSWKWSWNRARGEEKGVEKMRQGRVM